MGDACTYCGCDVERHDPVYVERRRDGGRVRTGQFCNYACLARHVEEENLTVGTTCEFDPDV